MQLNHNLSTVSERVPMGFVRNTFALLLPAVASIFLSGCAMTTADINPGTSPGGLNPGATLGGSIHGGQQAVVGSAIKMYAAGTTGYGSASTSIMNSGVTVLSDANGNFSLTGKYTCPSSDSLIYVTATGGDAGAGNNSAVGMMAALGTCGSLSSSTFIYINEVSTYAAVAALAPFMASPVAIGTSATNALGLTNAFADVTILASLSAGTSPGPGAATNMVVSSTTLYTVANILAACINSTGPASMQCSTLFTNTALSGVTPTETLTAAINIAKRPANNAATLYALQSAASPFQPTLPAAPSDYLLTAYVPTAVSLPQSIVADSMGGVFVPSYSNAVRYASNLTSVYNTATGAAINSVSLDGNNNAWLAQGTKITKVTSAGVLTSYTGASITSAYGIAVDGQGQIWFGNSGNATIGALNQNGTAISGSPFTVPYAPGDLIFSTH